MKLKLTTTAIVLNLVAFAQLPLPPTGVAPPANTPLNLPAVRNAVERAWYRGGNNLGGTAAAANIFGTMWNSPVYHYTTGKHRLTVWDDTFAPAGLFGTTTPFGGGLAINLDPANPITRPWSLLTIGENNGFNSGWRNWMSVGTFYGKSSDNMYVGLKDETVPGSNDRQDAVINWGDNTNFSGTTEGPDYLRFIFTSPLNVIGYPPVSSGQNGLEVMRMNWEGKVGVGNYYNSLIEAPFSKDPARRFELLSDKTSVAANGNPTFRITHSQQNPLALLTTGKYSEFEDRNTGDLFINTRNNTLATTATRDFKQRYIGVNTNAPGNTMEINSQFASSATPNGFGGTGWAGLRFTDLNSTSTPNTIVATKVLSVDANGDVILVNGGGNTLGNTCGGLANPLLTNWEIPLNNQNFIFSKTTAGTGRVGIGTMVAACTPGNLLEVRKGGAASAISGLRLTDLAAAIPLAANTKVLSIDANGDVIVTNAPVGVGGTALGNLCSAAPAPLLGNYQIPMAGNNFNYTMPALSTSQVNIGQVACATNPARLYVENDNLQIGGSFLTNGNFVTTPYGVYSKVHNNTFNVTTVGIYGEAEVEGPNAQAIGVEGKSVYSTPSSARNIGGKFTAANGFGDSNAGYFEVNNSNSANNFGVFSNISLSTNPSATNYGLFSTVGTNGVQNVGGAFNANGALGTNYGIQSQASSPGAVTNWGGYFVAAGGVSNYGIQAIAPVTPTDWAGRFDGNVFINGTGTSPGPGLIFSDQNLKENVLPIKEQESIDLLNKLNPVTYNLNNAYAPQLNVNTDKTYGLIAQQVALVIPELVKDVIVPAKRDSLGTVINPSVTLKSMNYNGLIPITINAIKHLNQRQNSFQSALNQAGLSDSIIKTGVSNFNALAKIKTLNPVTYNFTNASVPQLSLSSKAEYGFIAQQLETVYPELVDTVRIPAKLDSLGAVLNPSKVLKTVNYKAMNGLLVRAIQEQQSKIDSLISVTSKQDSINAAVANQIATLTTLINSCCSNASARTNNSNTNSLDVELSDKDAIVLDQNVPNPFAEQTTITYNVPTSVAKAQILFYNATGQLIQTVDIKTRGKGKVNVFASDLSSGLYHYSLVADGKIIDSKKMVRE